MTSTPQRAEWDDIYSDPLSDVARAMPIDLEKFHAILRQGRAAQLELSDLSNERNEAYQRLKKLEVELAEHPNGPYARHPPRPELKPQIEAAKQRLEFCERELSKVRDLLISRRTIAARAEEYARRRGLNAALESARFVPFADALRTADAGPPDPAPAEPLPIAADASHGGRT